MSVIKQVFVWPDGSLPTQSMLDHALEWASRLRVPLHAGCKGTLAGQAIVSSRDNPTGSVPSETGYALLRDYAERCERLGIGWSMESSVWENSDQGSRSSTLHLFGTQNGGGLKLLPVPSSSEIKRLSGAPIMLCPPIWKPLSRVLLLNTSWKPSEEFFALASQVCKAFQVSPVVLTLARTERRARLRQQIAQQIYSHHFLPADFDFVVGRELPDAVASVANWRRCSLVLAEQQHEGSWWYWRGPGDPSELIRLARTLSVLVVPVPAQPAVGARPGAAGERAHVSPKPTRQIR